MSRGGRWARLLARALLRLYPEPFRVRHGAAYVEGTEHLWRRERSAVGPMRAALRLARVMLVDAWTSVPEAWWAGRAPNARAAGSRAVLTGWTGDLRAAARSLRRRPGYALLVAGTLGLGIGASAAVFAALDRVVLRPLPYAGAERLVYVLLRNEDLGWRFSPLDEVVERWRTRARTLQGIETYGPLSMVRTGDGPAELLRTTGYSTGLPRMLGVPALVGRILGPEDLEASASPAVVLSERYWRAAWGADPGVVGRTLRLNDTTFTVAGVWPEWARLDHEGAPDLYRVLPPGEGAQRGVLARVASGVSVASAQAELTTLLHGMTDQDLPGVDVAELLRRSTAVVQPPHASLGDAYVRGLWIVFFGGVLLMVVAVANAANLVLSRSSARRRTRPPGSRARERHPTGHRVPPRREGGAVRLGAFGARRRGVRAGAVGAPAIGIAPEGDRFLGRRQSAPRPGPGTGRAHRRSGGARGAAGHGGRPGLAELRHGLAHRSRDGSGETWLSSPSP